MSSPRSGGIARGRPFDARGALWLIAMLASAISAAAQSALPDAAPAAPGAPGTLAPHSTAPAPQPPGTSTPPGAPPSAPNPGGAGRNELGPGTASDDAAWRVAIIEISSDAEAATFAASLATSLAADLVAIGMRPLRKGTADGSLTDAELAGDAFASGARWAALARCSIDGKRLVWRLSVYDAIDGAIVAADAKGAFAGLSAVAGLAESSRRVAAALEERRARTAEAPLLGYRLRFESSDEGALVSLGSGPDGIPMGTIAWHGLSAPYFALVEGRPIAVTISKEGRWPRSVEIRPGSEDLPIELPPLQVKTRGALALSWSNARPFGAGIEYRHHLIPDALFLRAGNRLWFADGQGLDARAALHDEASIGAGFYAFRPRNAALRIALGAGASAIGTLDADATTIAIGWLDGLIEPLWLSLEWHKADVAYFIEERLLYSIGLDGGLLRRGWLGSSGPPLVVSVGIMRKWP